MSPIAAPNLLLTLILLLIPGAVLLILTVWVQWLSYRAVRALESIAESLRLKRNS